MRRKILLLTIEISIFLLVISCCPKNRCVDFSEAEKEWMPYKNNDSLYFYNTQDSSQIILGVRDSLVEKEQHKEHNMFSCSNGCMNIIRVKIYTIKCNFNYQFDYFIEKTKIEGKQDDFFVEAGNSYAYGVFKNTINNYDFFSLEFSKHHETLVVSNKTLNDVYEYSTPNKELKFQKMYVCQGIGIVKIELLNNKEFELSSNNRLMKK